MVFYALNFVLIFGVGFLLICLRHFAQEARPRHTRLREGIAQPLEVLKSSGNANRTGTKAGWFIST